MVQFSGELQDPLRSPGAGGGFSEAKVGLSQSCGISTQKWVPGGMGSVKNNSACLDQKQSTPKVKTLCRPNKIEPRALFSLKATGFQLCFKW